MKNDLAEGFRKLLGIGWARYSMPTLSTDAICHMKEVTEDWNMLKPSFALQEVTNILQPPESLSARERVTGRH